MDMRRVRRPSAAVFTAVFGLTGTWACAPEEREEEPIEVPATEPAAEASTGAGGAAAELEDRTAQQLFAAYKQDGPFDADAPDHLWFDNGDGTVLFLHFDAPVEQASQLNWVGYGVRGRWCAEEQPEGFTHFHRTARVPTFDAGHGGSTPGDEGYWLKHVAIERLQLPEMMGMPARTVEPGLDREFMPTNPPSCG